MQTWSSAFDAHIDRLGLSSAEVAVVLKVSASCVWYWRHGATPRAKTCRTIQRWSKGAVRASLARRVRASKAA